MWCFLYAHKIYFCNSGISKRLNKYNSNDISIQRPARAYQQNRISNIVEDLNTVGIGCWYAEISWGKAVFLNQ